MENKSKYDKKGIRANSRQSKDLKSKMSSTSQDNQRRTSSLFSLAFENTDPDKLYKFSRKKIIQLFYLNKIINILNKIAQFQKNYLIKLKQYSGLIHQHETLIQNEKQLIEYCEIFQSTCKMAYQSAFDIFNNTLFLGKPNSKYKQIDSEILCQLLPLFASEIYQLWNQFLTQPVEEQIIKERSRNICLIAENLSIFEEIILVVTSMLMVDEQKRLEIIHHKQQNCKEFIQKYGTILIDIKLDKQYKEFMKYTPQQIIGFEDAIKLISYLSKGYIQSQNNYEIIDSMFEFVCQIIQNGQVEFMYSDELPDKEEQTSQCSKCQIF